MHKLFILIEIKHKQKAFWPSDSILTNLYYKINILTHENEKMETQLKSVMLFLLINLNSLVKDVWTDSKAKPGSIWFIKDYP